MIVFFKVVIELEALEATDVEVPLFAVTVNVYVVSGLNPVIVIVPEPAWVKVAVIPPGDDVAVYEMMVAPPLLLGAVKATVAVVAPVVVAVPIVGAVEAVTAEVTGKSAETEVLPPVYVTVVAPATVKKLFATPVTV